MVVGDPIELQAMYGLCSDVQESKLHGLSARKA